MASLVLSLQPNSPPCRQPRQQQNRKRKHHSRHLTFSLHTRRCDSKTNQPSPQFVSGWVLACECSIPRLTFRHGCQIRFYRHSTAQLRPRTYPTTSLSLRHIFPQKLSKIYLDQKNARSIGYPDIDLVDKAGVRRLLFKLGCREMGMPCN